MVHYDELDDRHPIGVTVRAEAAPGKGRNAALCLSGGGQRAGAYHLGALQRLWELGVLQEIDEIRAVSGGAYLAAWIATVLQSHQGRWETIAWEADIAVPFRRFLEADHRTWPILATAPVNLFVKGPRLRLLRGRIEQTLPLASSIAGLERPEIKLLATDLIAAELIELPDPSLVGASDLLGAAIASSAFPPFIGPMRTRMGQRPLQLSDGGLLGNLGVGGETIQLCGTVLVSDASYPPRIASSHRMPRTWLLRALRVAGRRADELVRYQVWMTDVRLRRLQIWAINKTSCKPEDEFPAHEYPRHLVDRIASIRTDLSGLTTGQRSVLENHGYLRAASCVSWLGHRMRLRAVSGEHPANNVDALLVRTGERPHLRMPFPELFPPERCLAALGAASSRRRYR